MPVTFVQTVHASIRLSLANGAGHTFSVGTMLVNTNTGTVDHQDVYIVTL